ncbi:hypothetical protein CEXT_181921 [Caerostris extrusa]|uniref:Uncharacterized protein n=1 Tax=Caerostris extrusa TaxID=172846 RepID=A0AAV4QQ02_CAEEX|nr:hypothetical protein CEXT_181921 [Caerostris extrusa]
MKIQWRVSQLPLKVSEVISPPLIYRGCNILKWNALWLSEKGSGNKMNDFPLRKMVRIKNCPVNKSLENALRKLQLCEPERLGE